MRRPVPISSSPSKAARNAERSGLEGSSMPRQLTLTLSNVPHEVKLRAEKMLAVQAQDRGMERQGSEPFSRLRTSWQPLSSARASEDGTPVSSSSRRSGSSADQIVSLSRLA